MGFLNEYDIRYFESIDSTHSFCRTISAGNVVVYAGEQTAGYGKRMRPWLSPYGNLYVSIAADFNIATSDLNFFSLFVCCAVRDFLTHYISSEDDLKLHWPNDVYLNGKKLSGMLLEIPSHSRCIISVGVNTTVLPRDNKNSFASLNIVKDKQELVQELIFEIRKWYNKFITNRDNVVDYWRKWIYVSSDEVTISYGDSKIVGFINGVSDNGSLLVKVANGDIKSFVSGDVFSV